MKIIHQESKYLVLRNCTSVDDEVIALGGKAYITGDFLSDPESTRIHEARCKVLQEYGVDVEEDVVVILDRDWAKDIDEGIENLLLKTKKLRADNL